MNERNPCRDTIDATLRAGAVDTLRRAAVRAAGTAACASAPARRPA